ncbi:MAG: Thiol-disulfide oxidoreductase ResA [Fimbriimonadales bacterium]|nr:MAG: TlpA family protein disulfide reductase [Armatimonadota bacterium]MBV6503353.1 Thiol-disulfide oxidoreductase ResA [Fimbriimonadales bacterium]MCE7899853.1 TlpA family protein disulfide reductase [Armatimonadetes bacterium ATM1]MDL1928693.1 TlpA family protein disulfide reductase [Fimbriimonadia bacterium ATM]MBC6968724.1 TlpA family protein disulfide reductase [Armatimonadota bacterium]
MLSQILATLTAGLTLAAPPVQDQQPLSAGEAVPNYTFLEANSGKNFELHSLKGKAKLLLLDFFASWCGPCQKVIPELIEMNNKYKSKGLMVVGINVSDTWDDMRKNMEEKGINYLVLHDAKGRNPGNVNSLFRVRGIPTVFAVDAATMKVVKHWVGANPNHLAGQMAILKQYGIAN